MIVLLELLDGLRDLRGDVRVIEIEDRKVVCVAAQRVRQAGGVGDPGGVALRGRQDAVAKPGDRDHIPFQAFRGMDCEELYDSSGWIGSFDGQSALLLGRRLEVGEESGDARASGVVFV
jgi:hypothetical protein